MRQHRYQQIDASNGGRSQNGAQLGQEHVGVGQTPADRPQTQRRVQVRIVPRRLVQRLVGTDVHGANGHRQTLHTFNSPAVGLVLLLFVGQFPLATHKQELAAKQTHTDGTGFDGAGCVLGHFNVGQQLYFLAIERYGRSVQQARQASALNLALALPEPVFGQDDGRRINNHDPRVAVNYHPVVLPH